MLSKSSMKTHAPMIDLESSCLVRDLYKASSQGRIEISVKPFVRRFALSVSLTLSYGIRIDSWKDELLQEILDVGSGISLLRSASENYQDYVPLLRWLPNRKRQQGIDLRARRDQYVKLSMDAAREQIRDGIDIPCVSSAVLKGEETTLTKMEIGSICLSMISGGFESVPATFMMCIASLGTEEGQAFQEQAYQSIINYYSTVEAAWSSSHREEQIPYINALIKETLRQFTVTPMIPPHLTASDISWNDAVIPKNTIILVNAQAANHDIKQYGSTANRFDPLRWLETKDPKRNNWTDRPATGLQHLAFGAGARNCVGAGIANRMLYTAILRTICCFQIRNSKTRPPNTDPVDYNEAKSALVAHAKDFDVHFQPRSGVDIGSLLRETKL
ncbi:uncharacterized protein JN550_005749 [Neoarthrinium moseri]|uniref:uncharacterized protein n=1 Tax=Neoarthrinium moseri TaxID=1658444 RepID=UPI001FDB5F7F|nr:uncharacterized protein JN550_005749 [Neoarthrinium moseri]KAI1869768.1 hypothetical protein JN550_005749 [Neoarthrinium moseri]